MEPGVPVVTVTVSLYTNWAILKLTPMEIEMNTDATELREDILDLVLSIYNLAAAANGWTEPPAEVEKIMDEIFKLVTVGLNIKE